MSRMVRTPGRANITLGMAFTEMAAVAMSPAIPPLTVMSIEGEPSITIWSFGPSAPTYMWRSRLTTRPVLE